MPKPRNQYLNQRVPQNILKALANAMFLADAGTIDDIKYKTAAKDRIRWLSVQLHLAQHALGRIASAHTPSPQFPNGHIWSADCDACNYKTIAAEAIK